MSFKTTNSREIPAVQFERAVRVAVQVKREAKIYRTQALNGSVRTADLYTGLLGTLIAARAELVKARATTGIGAYAAGQYDTGYDIAAEFIGLIAKIDAMITWLESNFPASPSKHLQIWSFVGDGSGQVVSDTITSPGQLTALAAQLDALIATID